MDKRRISVKIPGVRIGAAIKEEAKQSNILAPRRVHQGRLTPAIPRIHRRAAPKEKVYLVRFIREHYHMQCRGTASPIIDAPQTRPDRAIIADVWVRTGGN